MAPVPEPGSGPVLGRLWPASGPKSAPKLPGPPARACGDRVLVRSHKLSGPNRPKMQPFRLKSYSAQGVGPALRKAPRGSSFPLSGFHSILKTSTRAMPTNAERSAAFAAKAKAVSTAAVKQELPLGPEFAPAPHALVVINEPDDDMSNKTSEPSFK